MNKVVFLLSILLFLFSCQKKVEKKPLNIVLILTDDQGYQDLGCFGSPDIKTPRIDQLASEGMRFTDFYMASSVCSASRAALLTGCYPQRVGVRGVFFNNRGDGLDPKHITIADALKEVGYNTAAVGKWHLGSYTQFLPTKQGFDSYYGIPYSNDMSVETNQQFAADCLFREGFSKKKLDEAFAEALVSKKPLRLPGKVPLVRNETCIEFPVDQTTITRRYTDEGIRFISQSVKAGKPFFLYLAHSMPHVPLFSSPDFQGKSEAGPYGDVIEEIDFNTGRIMDHLKKLGIEENTIVIFTSDNGPWLVKEDGSGHADPLFEGKFTSFEGGFRVPFIIKWPGPIPSGSVCRELATAMDLFPTLAGITGAPLPPIEMDGKDMIDLWTHTDAKTPHDFFFYVNKVEAVRSGDWKYHKRALFAAREPVRWDETPTLYNLKNDIGESTNVIEDHPEVTDRLAKALEMHLERISEQNK